MLLFLTKLEGMQCDAIADKFSFLNRGRSQSRSLRIALGLSMSNC
ncbi:MAG: hypothetical protein V7K29_23895 [Nostoc sp.]